MMYVLWILLLLVASGSVTSQGSPGEIHYILTDQVDKNTFIGNLIQDANLDKKYRPRILRTLRFGFLTPSISDFFVEEKTGILRTNSVIDRDEVCPRQNVCEIKLDIAVQPVRYFQIIKVSIEILDVNDNAPTFPETHVTHQILESASPGASFLLPNAIDNDSPQFGIRGYDMETDTRKFDLQVTEKVDGSVDVRLVLKERLDREKEDEYKVRVIATDGGDPPQSGAVDITITVLDANDHDPKFEQKVYEVNVREDVKPDTSLIRVHAIDPDAGRNGRVVYSFSERTTSTYGDIFGIDQHSGEIYVKGSIDYETSAVYHLAVVAEDKGPDSLPDDATVIVRVEDINDHAPEITVNTLSSAESDVAEILEDTEIGTFVAHITVIDKDKGMNGEVGCSLNSENFQLIKLYNTEYKIVTASELDREKQDEYEMVLLCQDSGEDVQIELKNIKVRVLDVNDHRPVFEHSEYKSTLYENNFVGADVTQVNATDGDIGDNAKIEYSIANDVAALFTVDPKSGYVKVATSFDREETDHISFYVLAKDHGEPSQTGSALVHVTILDVNDKKPEFSEESYSFKVHENEPVGTDVGKISAIDLDTDPYNKFTFSLVRSRSDVDSFSIDPLSGLITTRNVLNREDQSVYFLVVMAEDSGNPPLTSTVSVSIQVEDKNDWQPVFDFPTSYNNTVFISNQVPRGHVICTIRAHDVDLEENAQLHFGITAHEGLFEVEELTGHVRVIGDLGPVEHELYEIFVTATDSGDPPLHSTVPLYVLVNKTIHFSYADKQQTPWSILGTNSFTFIIILALCSALITIFLVIAIICIRRKDRNKQEHGKYNCRTEALKMLSNSDREDYNTSKYTSDTEIKANGEYESFPLDAPDSPHGSQNSWRSESPNQVTKALLPADSPAWQAQQKEMEVHQLLEMLKKDADTDSAYSEDGTDSGSGKDKHNEEQQNIQTIERKPDKSPAHSYQRAYQDKSPAHSYQKPAFSTFSPNNTCQRKLTSPDPTKHGLNARGTGPHGSGLDPQYSGYADYGTLQKTAPPTAHC